MSGSCHSESRLHNLPRVLRLSISLAAFLFLAAAATAQETATVRVADGFDLPVGRDGTKQYFKARGFRANGHLGEDWNGVGGGDTDLGDPVYAIAHGLVVFARDYRLGWGNVVIVRHAYVEEGATRYVDSLYGHLHEMLVTEGQQLSRGQKLGTIGNNRGMYDAHLHFELRKNLSVGMHRNSFPRDASVYWDPAEFIPARNVLPGGERFALVPINTFAPTPPPVYATQPAPLSPLRRPGTETSVSPRGPFRVERYSDLKGQ